MKKVFMALFVFAMLMGIGTVAQASLIQDVNPVRFYVVEDTGDTSVILSVVNTFNPSVTLEYSTNGSDWDSAIDSMPFALSEYGRQLVYWRLNKGSQNYDYVGDLLFMGYDHDDLWNGVTIYWDENQGTYTKLTFVVTADCDNVAPVPIPASALLLGSGIVGLIAFGQRMRKRVS